MYKQAEELIRELRVDIKSPRQNVATMSGGQRQMVACARAIAFKSTILIMDEPTAALGVTEANKLLGLIRSLADKGISILLITQRIPDVLAIADRVFVLKGGVRQGVLKVGEITPRRRGDADRQGEGPRRAVAAGRRVQVFRMRGAGMIRT